MAFLEVTQIAFDTLHILGAPKLLASLVWVFGSREEESVD